jgi:hypothetical protein
MCGSINVSIMPISWPIPLGEHSSSSERQDEIRGNHHIPEAAYLLDACR